MIHYASKAEDDDIPTASDTVVYLSEIEVEDVKEVMKSAPSSDPFVKIPDENHLPRKFAQKKSRLEKRLVGQGGAESKYIDPELVTGYSLFNLVTPPYDLNALAQLYDESYVLRAVVDARVMNTVGLGITWKPTSKAKKQIEKASGDDHKISAVRSAHQKEIDMLTDLFENFNEEETLIETLIKVWTDVQVLGNGYLEIGRKNNGEIGYIGHVPANLVRVRRPRDGFVQQANWRYVFFRNFGDQETVDPVNGDGNANELVHFKLYSPTNNWYGVPPSVSALSAIVGDKFAKEFNIDYFENKAIPRYAIILKGVKLSARSKQEIINYFRNEVKGTNHGTLVIPLPASIGTQTQADVKFEKLEDGVQEASFSKYRKDNQEDVLVAYRTPPTKVAIFENANLAVSRDADKTFKAQVVGPDQTTVDNRVNRIVKEFSSLFYMEFTQFDLLDEDTRSRINDRYARIQVKTPNEIRGDIGEVPVDGGDFPLPFPDANLKYTQNMTEEEGKLYTKLTGNPATMAGSKVGALANNPPKPIIAPPKPASGGAGPGNTNGQVASPKKSGEDNGTATSNKDVAGTNADRGALADQGKSRDRVGGK